MGDEQTINFINEGISKAKQVALDMYGKFVSSGYDILNVGPYEASFWSKRVGLLRRLNGLEVTLDYDEWKKISAQFDKGNFTSGKVDGFSLGEYNFLVIAIADLKRKVACIYTVYFHYEIFRRIKRNKILFISFKDVSGNVFLSYLNDKDWHKVLEKHHAALKT
jgi:hypothetical protein